MSTGTNTTNMITTKQLRKEFHKLIKDIAKTTTHRDMAWNCGVTENTINNAVNYPDRVKLETLELIIKKNS